MLSLRFKLWLHKEGKVFGEGPYRLLEGVAQEGSLSSSAKKMGMSYSQAYNLLKAIETKLGFSLITSKAGGAGGGGSELTEEARQLMKRYRAFSSEAEEALEEIFQKHFPEGPLP